MEKLTKDQIEAVQATIEKGLAGKSEADLNGRGEKPPWNWRETWDEDAFEKDPVDYIENHAPPLLVPEELERWARFAPREEAKILARAKELRALMLAFLAEWPDANAFSDYFRYLTQPGIFLAYYQNGDFKGIRERIGSLKRQMNKKHLMNI